MPPCRRVLRGGGGERLGATAAHERGAEYSSLLTYSLRRNPVERGGGAELVDERLTPVLGYRQCQVTNSACWSAVTVAMDFGTTEVRVHVCVHVECGRSGNVQCKVAGSVLHGVDVARTPSPRREPRALVDHGQEGGRGETFPARSAAVIPTCRWKSVATGPNTRRPTTGRQGSRCPSPRSRGGRSRAVDRPKRVVRVEGGRVVRRSNLGGLPLRRGRRRCSRWRGARPSRTQKSHPGGNGVKPPPCAGAGPPPVVAANAAEAKARGR